MLLCLLADEYIAENKKNKQSAIRLRYRYFNNFERSLNKVDDEDGNKEEANRSEIRKGPVDCKCLYERKEETSQQLHLRDRLDRGSAAARNNNDILPSSNSVQWRLMQRYVGPRPAGMPPLILAENATNQSNNFRNNYNYKRGNGAKYKYNRNGSRNRGWQQNNYLKGVGNNNNKRKNYNNLYRFYHV